MNMNTEKFKILYVIHTPKDERTAVYKICRQTRAYLESQGQSLEILTPDDFFSAGPRLLPVLYPFQAAWKILFSRELPDLILFHSYSGWVFNAVRKIFPRFRHLKTAAVFHGLEPVYFEQLVREAAAEGKPLSFRFRFFYCFLQKAMIRRSCRLSDLVLCLNENEKKYMTAHGYQSAERIHVTPNGVSAVFLDQPRAERGRISRLLFVGQWMPRKGVRYLVRAFEKLAAQHPELELTLAGTLVPDEQVLQAFSENLRSRVRVRRMVSPEEMPAFYAEADIFVFPSLMEGFSLALIEAMASGLPAVTTRAGAAEDVILDGVDGIFIPDRDAEALADAVSKLVRSPETALSIGLAAREKARAYEISKTLARWWRTCRSVLGEKKEKAGVS